MNFQLFLKLLKFGVIISPRSLRQWKWFNFSVIFFKKNVQLRCLGKTLNRRVTHLWVNTGQFCWRLSLFPN